MDTPAGSANKMISGDVDIALAPVIILNQLPHLKVISDYCIGAVSPVRTVCLFSTVPIREIKKLYVDNHSRTSVKLLEILMLRYWNIQGAFHEESVYPDMLKEGEAALVIGDKAFYWHGRFPYTYDLAEAWIEFTGLPFVFAGWMIPHAIPDSLTEQLNAAIAYGLKHIEQVAEEVGKEGMGKEVLMDYYTRHISFYLDEAKREGMATYLNMAAKLP